MQNKIEAIMIWFLYWGIRLGIVKEVSPFSIAAGRLKFKKAVTYGTLINLRNLGFVVSHTHPWAILHLIVRRLNYLFSDDYRLNDLTKLKLLSIMEYDKSASLTDVIAAFIATNSRYTADDIADAIVSVDVKFFNLFMTRVIGKPFHVLEAGSLKDSIRDTKLTYLDFADINYDELHKDTVGFIASSHGFHPIKEEDLKGENK